MQMYVGIVTLITLYVLSNLLAQPWSPMVSDSVLYAELKLLLTLKETISVERDVKHHSPKTTI